MKTPSINIVSLFLNAANQYPEQIAIIDGAKEISFANLEKEVKATAAYFAQKGIKPGDRVLVFVPMSIDLYRIVLALFYLGATAVFLDEWVSKKRLETCCQLADCKGFIGIFKARVFAFFSKELRRIPIKLSLHKQVNQPISMAVDIEDTPALLTFTTGSTGTPKAAQRSHPFLKEQFDALLDEIQPKVTDIDLPLLPIVLFVNLGIGCTSVIANFKMSKPEAMDAAAICQQIRQHKINRITASPFFIQNLAEHILKRNSPLLGIEKVFTGGAPVFPNKAQVYTQAFPNAKSTIVYGSTEAEPISSIDAADLANQKDTKNKGLLVGQPFHKAAVKIIPVKDEAIQVSKTETLETLADGQVGEIIVSGPHVLKQYFRNEKAFVQNKILIGDTIWHRTGDSGFLEEGQLFLTGRCQQLINQGTEYLSPFIIENKLQNIPGIKLGTLIKAKSELILAIQSRLSLHQLEDLVKEIPYDKIRLLAKIPMDPRHYSKIDYGRLQALLA